MNVLPQAINHNHGTAFENRLKMRRDKEAIFNTPATGRRIILKIQLLSSDFLRML